MIKLIYKAKYFAEKLYDNSYIYCGRDFLFHVWMFIEIKGNEHRRDMKAKKLEQEALEKQRKIFE